MNKKCHSTAETNQCPGGDASNSRIAERAYYLAESRRFEPSHELDDWLEAEFHEKLDPGAGYSMMGFQS